MTRAHLRYLLSADAPDGDLRSYRPDDPEEFRLLVQALIGPSDAAGEESFEFLVCTPAWLAQQASRDGFVWGRHYLVLPKYSYEAIESAIQKLVQRVEGPNWESVAETLARYGGWEFEDYTDYPAAKLD